VSYRTACLTICTRHLEVSDLLCDDYPEIALFHCFHAFEMITLAGIGRDVGTQDHERRFWLFANELTDVALKSDYIKTLTAIGGLSGQYGKAHQTRNATLYVQGGQEPSNRFKATDAKFALEKVGGIVEQIQETFD
jgi:hypothetical protein